VALKSDTAAEKSKDQLSRDFPGRSIFDFCNSEVALHLERPRWKIISPTIRPTKLNVHATPEPDEPEPGDELWDSAEVCAYLGGGGSKPISLATLYRTSR
jgi:hypothetical protein